MNLEDEPDAQSPLDRLMVGLPADVVLRRQMRRASGGDMDYLVIRLLAHDISWGTYREILDEWTLDELVDANRASDVADRLRRLQEGQG